MKLKYTSEDFYISTGGLDILKKIMYFNIACIYIIAIYFCNYIYNKSLVNESVFPKVILILAIATIIALPSIILCLLVGMMIDWMNNVKMQSKIQYNISNNSEDIKEILNKMLELKQLEQSND